MYALTPPPPPTLSLTEQERIRSYLEAGVAPATRRAYQSSWEAWQRWCDARQVPALPAAPEQIAAWLSERAEGGAKVATLEKDLAALSAVHRIAEMLGPRSHPAVRAVLRGIRRKVGVAQRQVTALRVEDLRAALPRGEGARALRDRALLLVGFAGALRRSELVALDHGDVEFRSEGLVLRLRASKTDPERRGVQVAIPYAKRAEGIRNSNASSTHRSPPLPSPSTPGAPPPPPDLLPNSTLFPTPGTRLPPVPRRYAIRSSRTRPPYGGPVALCSPFRIFDALAELSTMHRNVRRPPHIGH